MSVSGASHSSIRNFIQRCESIEDELEENRDNHVSSLLAKCTAMLNTPENPHSQRIEVEYENKGSCCLIGFRSICSFWSFCQKVNCFGITHNYYTTTSSSGGVVLHPKTSLRPPTAQQNQVTNASFFLELHNTLDIYLIPAWKLSVVYIEDFFSREDAAYWESWDPLSKEYTPRHQMDFFREIIIDAAETMKKTRRQAMREYLRREDEKILSAGRRRGRSVGEVSLRMQNFSLNTEAPQGNQEQELSSVEGHVLMELHQKRARANSATTDSLRPELSKSSSSGEEFSTPPEQSALPVGDKKPSARKGICEPEGSPSSSPIGKAVMFQEGCLPFDREKIIEDILAVTLATQRQAKEMVNELEEEILFPCSVKEKWDAIKKVVKKRKIQLRDIQEGEISEELSEAVMNDFYLQDEGHLREMENIIAQEKGRKKRSGCFTFCKRA